MYHLDMVLQFVLATESLGTAFMFARTSLVLVPYMGFVVRCRQPCVAQRALADIVSRRHGEIQLLGFFRRCDLFRCVEFGNMEVL